MIDGEDCEEALKNVYINCESIKYKIRKERIYCEKKNFKFSFSLMYDGTNNSCSDADSCRSKINYNVLYQ